MEAGEPESEHTIPSPPAPPGIMDLPREVRGVIFNNLRQSTILPCRLVSKTWKQEIDELYEFKITFNDKDQPINWTRIGEIHCIKSILIQSFMSRDPRGDGLGIFKFPSYIRFLEIRSGFNILPTNFYYILSDCSSFLKKLSIHLVPPLLNSSFSSSLGNFNFGNLEKLKITVSTLPGENDIESTLLNQKEETVFIQLMENSTMSHLKSLRLDLRLLGSRQIIKFNRLILNFIGKYWRTLRIIDIDLLQGNHSLPQFAMPPIEIEEIDQEELNKVTQLQFLRIINSSPIGTQYWIQVLENQKQIESLEIDLVPAQNTIFTSLIPTWENTIVNVEISDLTVWNSDSEPVPFDLSIFQHCLLLKKLLLDRNVNIGAGGRRAFDTAELTNLHRLPSSLSELDLNYLNVPTEDFLLFTYTEVGNSIRNLSISKCGTTGVFGVTGSVLERFIGLNSLIFMEISMFNMESLEESVKLNGILVEHGYRENHQYFQLRKVVPYILVHGSVSLVEEEDEEEEPE